MCSPQWALLNIAYADGVESIHCRALPYSGQVQSGMGSMLTSSK